MSAELVQVAEAVTEELNLGSFSQPVSAERSYQPLFDLPEMSELHVTVVPGSRKVKTLGRNRNQYDLAVEIGVQKRLSGQGNDEADDLMALVEEIEDYFRLRRLGGFTQAIWIHSENSPVYDPEHLNDMHQFTSVLTLVYRVVR